jgi:2'-hydroxyisoflavone reductase
VGAARASRPLNILILGGTGFTGPAQVEYALARGHRVTLFNRDRTRPKMFATTFPAWVRNVARFIRGSTAHYIFVSTISVYADNGTPNADEAAATLPMPAGLDPYTLDRQHAGRYFGPLKARAETEVQQHYAGIFTIIRPGLIVGPLDQSDRFTYWPVRIDRGGEVLAPGTPDDPVQLIDARDLAIWTIRMAELGPKDAAGIYNGVGPRAPLRMADMLDGIKAITTTSSRFTWVPASVLVRQKIRPWRDMPVWIPPERGYAGFSRRNIARALAKGLTFRSLAVTAQDTLEWHKTRPEEDRKKLDEGATAGISAQREAEVLAAWRAARQEAR